MGIPKRLLRQAGRHALVDGIPFLLPVHSEQSPALMAGFTIDYDSAAALMPGNELHPFRLWGNKSVLMITVIDYRVTDIGKYVEFSIAIACTHGSKPAPPILNALLFAHYDVGQFVFDLPVSSEISVKGGKGIWGMPKHQANLDFVITDDYVSSQYDLDGRLAMRITIDRPKRTPIRPPMHIGAANYCQFRGMLMKSYIYFRGKVGVHFPEEGRRGTDHRGPSAARAAEIAEREARSDIHGLAAGFERRARRLLRVVVSEFRGSGRPTAGRLRKRRRSRPGRGMARSAGTGSGEQPEKLNRSEK